MKINKVYFYKTVLSITLLSQIYVPSFKVNIFLQLVVLLGFIFFEKPKISKEFLKNILPLFIILIIGFVGMFLFNRPNGQALKDFFHFIKPIQGIFIGYFFYNVINNQKEYIKTIVNIAVVSAVIHLLIVMLLTDFTSGSIHVIRSLTRDNFLELLALFFLLFYSFFFGEELIPSKIKRRLIFLILIFSCILYFSRTMMVAAIIFLLSIYGHTIITFKSVKIISAFIVLVVLLYTGLFSVNINRNASGLEAFLYKIKIAPAEIFETKIDRENHQKLWDHWRGYESVRAYALMNEEPISYLTGTGYGSLVNLKFAAPLNQEKKGMKYISELHNGYSYVLYKLGVFALILYLFFLFVMYKKVYSKFTLEGVFISALSLFYLFSTLTITGIYNTNDTLIIILGALLCSFYTTTKKMKI